MKKFITIALAALMTVFTLSSCEKDELLIHGPLSESPAEQQAPVIQEETTPKGGTPVPVTPSVPDQPTTQNNVSLEVRGPLGITVTAVLVDGKVHSVTKAIEGTTEVLSWHTDSVPEEISVEYEYEKTPRRFSFCPTDDDMSPVLEANLSAGKTTVFTVNLYTDEVAIE